LFKIASAEKGQFGRFNYGFYCHGCSEFFAIAVLPAGYETEGSLVALEFDPGSKYECPHCNLMQHQSATDIVKVVLNQENRRKPPPWHQDAPPPEHRDDTD
jgi:hypothetical protein